LRAGTCGNGVEVVPAREFALVWTAVGVSLATAIWFFLRVAIRLRPSGQVQAN
jgi:hypothetical protein